MKKVVEEFFLIEQIINSIMNYSITQLGNIVKLVAGFMVLLGMTPLTPEQVDSVVVGLGVIFEVIGFLMSWLGRYRKGDITLAGFRK